MSVTDEETIDLTVIIVSYNTRGLLARAITALQQSAIGHRFEVIVVDNASRDGSAAYIQAAYPWCRLVANTSNVGFGRANNQALGFVRGRYVLLLNTDAVVSPDTISTAIAYMDANSRAGILGVRLVDGNGVPQASARSFPTPLSLFVVRAGLRRVGNLLRRLHMIDDFTWDQTSPCSCDWVTGCFYLIRRKLIDQIGLFDPRYFLYYEETDHCFAAKRAGWEVVCVPHTTVMHFGGESIKSESGSALIGRMLAPLYIESELLYFRKNHGLAAVLADVILISLSALLNSIRRLLKNRPDPDAMSLKHVGLIFLLCLRTRFGARATR